MSQTSGDPFKEPESLRTKNTPNLLYYDHFTKHRPGPFSRGSYFGLQFPPLLLVSDEDSNEDPFTIPQKDRLPTPGTRPHSLERPQRTSRRPPSRLLNLRDIRTRGLIDLGRNSTHENRISTPVSTPECRSQCPRTTTLFETPGRSVGWTGQTRVPGVGRKRACGVPNLSSTKK